MQIIDCFIFYNECKMLDYRLQVLNSVVDWFVLVEATHTHVGREKPLFFADSKHLFAPYLHKIIHIVVDDFPCKTLVNKGEQWLNENFQRNCIHRGLNQLHLQVQDLIHLSDVDEIPDPTLLSEFKRLNYPIEINALEQDFYYYNMTCRSNEKWYQAKIFSYEFYKTANLSLNQIREFQFPFVMPGGWHLSYFGDTKFIQNKIQNFGHQEFNLPEILDAVDENRRNGTDLFNRKDLVFRRQPLEQNTYLPPRIDLLEAICNGASATEETLSSL
jgi:beta-1,4-mannosyl-glycoprotein beta-1,4-N-acetylglucosaminyltransferase